MREHRPQVGRLIVMAACLLPTACCRLAWADAARPLRIAFHVHTSTSDGQWSARQVLEEAQRQGLDGVVFADSLIERWEFGLPPLRGLMRRTMEEPSVLTWGAASYLEHLRSLRPAFPSLVIIPGVTVAPYYRWTDIPFFRHGSLEHWHRQLVVLGLEDARTLAEIPAVSNEHAAWVTVLRHPQRLWPVFPVLVGAVAWARAPRASRARQGSGFLILAGLLLCGNAGLRRTSAFDPYQSDAGARPYQATIDYVTAHGGLVFWAHPAITSSAVFYGIPVTTDTYTHLLFETHGYTGFGMHEVSLLQLVEPGQAWDLLLSAYCRGQRAAPPQFVGELAWHQPTRSFVMVETVVYATAATPAAVLEALRAGRMYAQFNWGARSDLVLTGFRVIDDSTHRDAGMGDTLESTEHLRVELTGQQHDEAPTHVLLIRNGRVVHEADVTVSPFTVSWNEAEDAPAAPSYYRALLHRGQVTIVTNPIFVRRHVP